MRAILPGSCGAATAHAVGGVATPDVNAGAGREGESMTALFSRRCALVLGGVRIPARGAAEGLKVEFRVEKTLEKDPNTLDLTVFNLSRESRAKAQAKGARLELLAGYADDVQLIFAGEIRSADHSLDGPNWKTKIQSGDGERAYSGARATESWGPGSKAKDVVAGFVDRMKVDPGNFLDAMFADETTFEHGFAASGRCSSELDRVLGACGMQWSIQDGEMQVIRKGATNARPALLISPATGLIGSPEIGTPEKQGELGSLKCKTLLRPGVRPGDPVQVVSEHASGAYRVEKLTHIGDTGGGPWYTELELAPTSTRVAARVNGVPVATSPAAPAWARSPTLTRWSPF
jgi:hypothetical protein